jgi:hypothetical protein
MTVPVARDISTYTSVGEWYEDYRGRVPVQTAAALARLMNKEGISFPEAYARLMSEGSIIEVDGAR